MTDYLDNSNKQLKLALQLVSGYAGENLSWRYPDSDPKAYTNINTYIKMAKTAEQGKFHTLFIADTPSLGGAGGGVDLTGKSPFFPMEPMTMLAAVATHTQKIGMVATFSTTYNLPYNLARQLKTLDIISGGRVGWNAVTTGTPHTAYNFGNKPLPDTTTRYEMADEMVTAVQSLWGSFGENAYIADQKTGEFIQMDKLNAVNFNGKYYQTKGPLPIPPSPQGQPPIFQAGPSFEGVELAGKFASGVYANPFTIEDARHYRNVLKQSAVAHGRNPNEINMFSGFMTTVADTREAALDRRRELIGFMPEAEFLGQIRYLSAMVGVDLQKFDLKQPLDPEILDHLSPNPQDPRSRNAVELFKQGYSPTDVLAMGAINYHPVVVGTPDDVADFMEEWFKAGATDGFSIVPESQQGVADFVEKVVPILQQRGLYHLDYQGDTLREHLGVAYQYGVRT
ncbi:FMN-dependent oxidoreductase, nitrilotriacetate monooxygenase [Mannheimia varigena USDA-ARS-USMARC-1296]|uniref:FMN-dependent oxidoreductase, nitrilotriacetate monooxygenase n=1 Tax=Mannheimia varigena USDA-ARS-USMARC-1296 TaxID=1433287 RepID=W0QF08_9PAST|nr:NtaA/DmoA family FMN-dependent monooxygenase [Mannheimia varigena]AHG75803.1 FMN-dependent oxidoreductase, nitrilotriacetate monooxygenase [Mannheimia varigena USDA-ARS-USMARC-1296]